MNIFSIFINRNDINHEVDIYKNTPNAVLLDVRSKEEFANGHIPGSVNVPVDTISDVKNVIKDLRIPIFVYCLRGTRSLRASGTLRKMGYENVRSIGGITAYKGELEK